jgi:hypothetical protein
MAFRALYEAGQATMGTTPPAMTGPEWMQDLLQYTYRTFNFGAGPLAGTYGAFNFGPGSIASFLYGAFPALPAARVPVIIQ